MGSDERLPSHTAAESGAANWNEWVHTCSMRASCWSLAWSRPRGAGCPFCAASAACCAEADRVMR